VLVAYLDESFTKSFFCFAAILADEHAIRDLSAELDAVASRHDTHALVIADDRDDRDSHRAHFALYKNFGTPGEYMSTRLDRLLDTVYFAPSHPSRLLQAADMLAYTYRRWNAQTEPDPRSQLTMDRLRGKITSSGKLHSPGNWP
jgi:hypothetical protein